MNLQVSYRLATVLLGKLQLNTTKNSSSGRQIQGPIALLQLLHSALGEHEI